MAAESTDQRLSLPKCKDSLDSDSDHRKKRMKVDNYSTTSSLVKNNVVAPKERSDGKDNKRRKVTAASGKDSRISRTSYSPLVKEQSTKRVEYSRKNNDSMEFKEEKKKKKKMKMEQCKKNQCWVIVKRMIVGKDGWVLKKCIDLKVLDYYDQIKEEYKLTTMKTIGLEDIEIKLNKFLYSTPNEFADDMRLVFSRAFFYPPKTQIHKIAKRLSESFEINWKSLKEKWRLEDRETRKMRRLHKGSNCK